MAENTEKDQGTRGYGVDVPRDGFVGRVVQDPKQPPNALLLSGFVGDSAEEGHLRLYSDPSLAQYVDVPEEAVLHSEPLPMDQSPLGGSHIWVRSDAKLLPQAAGVQQQQADFLGGQLFQEQLGGAQAVGGAPLQITLLTVAGCFTRKGSCPVASHHVPCIPQTLVGPRCLRPIRSIVSPCIPPTVLEPHCFQVQWPEIPQWEQPGGFQAQAFAAAPPTPGCPPEGFQGFAAAQPAVSAQCQMSFGPCPTHLLGCPSTSTCPPTDPFGCPRTSTCPPTFMPGCPSTSTCPPTDQFGCPRTSTCPPTFMPGCPSTSTCPPEQGFGQVGQFGQAGQGVQLTIATVCTQIGCQSLGIACTYLGNCGCLPMTVGPAVPTHPGFGFPPPTPACPPTRTPPCGCITRTVAAPFTPFCEVQR
jgi:hypothetical protein